MIDGEKITIGGKEYIFPDLTLGSIQKIWPTRNILSNPDHPECLQNVTKAFCLGLKRNYPEITEDFINDNMMIDEIGSMSEILAKQFEKLAKKKNQETLVPTTNPLTGENSTPE